MPQPLVQPGETRKPRARVLLDGKPVSGLVEIDVSSNNFYQADRFNATFALGADGAPTLREWSERAKATFAVSFGYEQRGTVNEWVEVITGDVERVTAEPELGRLQIDGRDLTARLIEARTQEAFQNKTSSQIAALLAERHGLKPVVTATADLASRYYKADHDKVSQDQFSRVSTEWDLLCKLAALEGFDVFVQGDELHFQPPADKPEPFDVFWRRERGKQTGDVMQLRLERSLVLAKAIVVEVRSWHSRKGRGFTRKSPPGTVAKDAQIYRFTRPNLTETQAQQEAERIRAEMTKHERIIGFNLPGETRLTCRDMVRLGGTDSTWDQSYFVEEITRSLSMDRGFVMSVRAKNRSAVLEQEGGL